MKKIVFLLKCICIAVTISLLSGCSDWLDVKPIDRQTANEIFRTKSGFWGSVNGVYRKLGDGNLYGRNLTYEMIEIMGKRYSIPPTNVAYTDINNLAYSSGTFPSRIERLWNEAYKTILTCNVILDNADKNEALLGIRDYNLIRGEMLAVRAFLHFDLLRLFGPVYSVNPEVASIPYNNKPVANLYEILPAKTVIDDYILNDLNRAEELLYISDPVIQDGPLPSKTEEEIEEGTPNTYRYRQVRFNYYAVLAIKARIYLYKGDMENALKYANLLINDSKVKEYFPPIVASNINNNTANPDRMFSCESLFGLYDDTRNNIFRDYFDPESSDALLLQPRKDYIYGSGNYLFSDMTSDYRRLYQWGIPGSATNREPILLKYKDITSNELFSATFIPLIRMAEVYLIAAEADALLNNNYMNGLSILNDFRATRGSGAATATSMSTLQTQIMYEYSREFYGEGQQFYYFKRRSVNIPAVCNGFSTSSFSVTGSNAYKLVIPLPVSETKPR